MISTPLGLLTQEQTDKLIRNKVFKKNINDQFSLISERVDVYKDDAVKTVFIPIRYYNMKYLLWKHRGDFNKAFSVYIVAPTQYLPAREGYTSYSKMINATLKDNVAIKKHVDMAKLANQMFLAE